MRNVLAAISTLALLGAVGGCARRMPPHATAVDAERSSVALADLDKGRQLVVSKCGSRCHKPPMPTDHTAAEWPHALDEMAPRANVSGMERQLIEQYLIALAKP